MKILVFSDTHGDVTKMERAIRSHSDAEVINPSVYCYIESQMVLTGGYAGFVSFNGVEQRQCETVDKQNCLIDTNFGFTHDKEIPLIINQQTYHIHYICDYN